MRLIPAIDIMDGKCVRLHKGKYDTMKIYSNDPLEMALRFEAHGIEYLHLVDLDGARGDGIVNISVLERICYRTTLKIDFGGGIKTTRDIQLAFDSGANQVTIGSLAVKNPDLVLKWLSDYGSEKIILGADHLDGFIAVNGWQESTDYSLNDFVKQWNNQGIKYVICTNISKDGTLQGPDLKGYLDLLDRFDLFLIASGGVTSINDLKKLKDIGLHGAIIGKAIYEGAIALEDLENIILAS